MKVLITILSMFLLIPVATYAQEYDDLYYTPEDREKARKNYQAKVSFDDQSGYRSADVNNYEITTPSITSDRIYNTSQGRTVNPEYVAQYRSRADARKQNTQQDEEVYFDENYDVEYYEEDDNARVVNNHYYGSSWANPYYDPFYVNDWRWRYNDWRWRRSSWYYDPYWSYAPGWSINVSIGWGRSWGGFYGHRWSRWSYDPWYSPYYAGGYYYNNFYDPYWAPPVYSNVYYSKVVYVNNESNNSIRRGPATSRGSVISGRRSSVAENGPVTRVPVRRSSLDGDRNGRVSSPSRTTSGRVIDRTGATTRSPRDYSNVEDGYNRSSIDRSGTNRSGIDRTTFPSRTRTTPSRTRTTPSRETTSPSRTNPNNNRTYTPSRSNNNNRTYTPSRSNNTRTTTPSRSNTNRSTTPSRRGGNDQSYSPSRGNSNNSGTRTYSAPQQRSSSPSYNRSSSGSSSSRSSSVSPSRSSSSSSSSSGRTSSGRRGGN